MNRIEIWNISARPHHRALNTTFATEIEAQAWISLRASVTKDRYETRVAGVPKLRGRRPRNKLSVTPRLSALMDLVTREAYECCKKGMTLEATQDQIRRTLKGDRT